MRTTEITLTTDYLKRSQAVAVPGAYFEDRAWRVQSADLTPRGARIIAALFPPVTVAHPEILELAKANAGRPVDYATPFVTDHGRRPFARVEAILAAKGWRLHDYQATDLSYLVAKLEHDAGAMLAWEVGLGKTLGTCAILDEWQANFNLIVCLNSAKEEVWEPALKEFVPWIETFVLPNEKRKREAMIDDLTGRTEPFNLITHFEAMPIIAGDDETSSGKWKPGKGWDRLGAFDLIAVDEAHRLANPDAKFVRSAAAVQCAGRLTMSGSFGENRLEELWGPVKWTYPKTYTAKWRQWLNPYADFIEAGQYGKKYVGPLEHALPQLRDELGKIMCYRSADDELDIPTPHERDIHVELTAAQRRDYDQLCEKLWLELESGETKYVEEGLSLLMALRQFADLCKVPRVLRGCEATDEQVLVFSWFKAPLDALAEKMGDGVAVVHGDIPRKRRHEAISSFRAGQARVLAATISTLSESQNFQMAGAVKLLGHSYNPEKNKQAVGRAVRQGQHRHVAVDHYWALDTVDMFQVAPVINSKDALRQLIFGNKEAPCGTAA